MAVVTERVVRAADVVLMVIDGREGLCADDYNIAKWLRPLRKGRPTLLVASKCEGIVGEECALEAVRLGLGMPTLVSAEHNYGLGDLARQVLPHIAEIDVEDEATGPQEITLAVVGQPNVGKSTLINALIGEDRLLTGPTAGLTRESIPVAWSLPDGTAIKLLDTAGLFRRAGLKDSSSSP
jgi:GTP-binding protein